MRLVARSYFDEPLGAKSSRSIATNSQLPTARQRLQICINVIQKVIVCLKPYALPTMIANQT